MPPHPEVPLSHSRKLALIRGINVGRAKRVAMADLRTLFSDFGYREVRTILNSGNIVFTAPGETAGEIAPKIERALLLRLDLDARVLVLSAPDVATVMSECALLDRATDHSQLLVAMPFAASALANLEPLSKMAWDDEALTLGSRAAYLWCTGGLADSKLAKAVSRALKDALTTRNWTTMLKVQALLDKGA